MSSRRQTTSPRSVVVISEKEDEHLPFVERHLTMPCVVIDSAGVMGGEELSYLLSNGRTHITHKDRSLDNVNGIWLRERWRFPTAGVPLIHRDYVYSAVKRHTEALYGHLKEARWVSDYYAMQLAHHKPLQLRIAARIGFKVPDTLFTSSAGRAKKFIDNYKTVITKPLGDFYLPTKEKDVSYMFFATKIHAGEKVNLTGLDKAPAIFQQAIDAVADLRVTVIGDKVFPAIIVDEKVDVNSPVRDWRVGHFRGKLCIEPYRIPGDIANKCIALVKELGLEFGAIDLVLDKKGELWFLENNANGQWAFIEEATGQPIGKALADLLQEKV